MDKPKKRYVGLSRRRIDERFTGADLMMALLEEKRRREKQNKK